MKAAILAGGLGTRLHPLTVDLPKPMVPLANRPIMSYLVELLARHGFDDLCVLLYHQPEVIKDYFKDGREFGVKIKYVEAPKDFGTAGAIRFACSDLKEPLLVISADLVTDIDLTAALDFHKKKKALATIVLTRVGNPLPYGIVISDQRGRVNKFLEKPTWGEVFSDTVNAGIYILEPKAIARIPVQKQFDFSYDLFPALLAENKALYGYVAEGYWKDIGKIEEYARTHYDLLTGRVKVDLKGKKFKKSNIFVGENVQVPASVVLDGVGIIGNNTIIGEHVVLKNTIIGNGCKIARDSDYREAIVWDGVEIGPEVRLERAIVCNDAVIGALADLQEGSVIGSETKVGREAVIHPFIKVWPRKEIEDKSSVSRSVIWRERWTRAVFDQHGVTGVCNVEITPQFAAALGAAYGSVLGKGSMISCSRDSHKASRMIFRALIAGILSTGVNISDLEMVPIPVNRYEVRSLKSKGGFHVRKSPFDPEVIDIKFFDERGMDISSAVEKKVERNFFGEDFVRARIEEAGELSYPIHRVTEEYRAGLFEHLDIKTIAGSNIKLAINYAYGSASQLFPSIMGELGLEVVALDAYIDETKITKDREAFERSQHQMAQIVKSLGNDLGIIMDTGAEKIFLCDEKGQMVDGRKALAMMALLALRSNKNSVIAVPVKESMVIDEL
ncbi:MAG: NTP transferase domain-containing protein, partial [Candidatus Margulisbacteria bacterium]|nr:NTP transferase domain-containing protein [Candidatus Margulisiibacteriota bacterium]